MTLFYFRSFYAINVNNLYLLKKYIFTQILLTDQVFTLAYKGIALHVSQIDWYRVYKQRLNLYTLKHEQKRKCELVFTFIIPS